MSAWTVCRHSMVAGQCFLCGYEDGWRNAGGRTCGWRQDKDGVCYTACGEEHLPAPPMALSKLLESTQTRHCLSCGGLIVEQKEEQT